ncbi:unnamed protein product [Schistosoma bovis]|nr:unnamed protein product [Schistosoma bovis]
MKLHYDQLRVQLMKENGHIQVNNLIIPKSIINQQTYRWNEFSNPTALNKSIQLRHIRHIHDHNNAMDNDNNNNVQSAENILYQINDNSAIDMITFNTDRRKSRMRNRMSPLSPRCSYIPKEKSPHSISSLDENEIDEVRKKLDHLQSLLIQVKNQLNSSPKDDDDDNKDSHKIDERIFANTLTELSLLQTTEMNTEENGQKINDSWQNLPNYVTFSVKKSHEYAVRNWLLSNFSHI